MKAILIDAKNRKLYAIMLDKDKPMLEQYYEHILCNLVEVADEYSYDNQSNILLVDEEGAINGTDYGFNWMGANYYGNGLIVGNNWVGDAIDTNLEVSMLSITFLP